MRLKGRCSYNHTPPHTYSLKIAFQITLPNHTISSALNRSVSHLKPLWKLIFFFHSWLFCLFPLLKGSDRPSAVWADGAGVGTEGLFVRASLSKRGFQRCHPQGLVSKSGLLTHSGLQTVPRSKRSDIGFLRLAPDRPTRGMSAARFRFTETAHSNKSAFTPLLQPSAASLATSFRLPRLLLSLATDLHVVRDHFHATRPKRGGSHSSPRHQALVNVMSGAPAGKEAAGRPHRAKRGSTGAFWELTHTQHFLSK